MVRDANIGSHGDEEGERNGFWAKKASYLSRQEYELQTKQKPKASKKCRKIEMDRLTKLCPAASVDQFLEASSIPES